MSDKSEVKRQGLRFQPEINTLIIARVDSENQFVGVAFSESHKGCGGAFSAHTGLKEGQHCQVKVGEIDFLNAKVRWIRPLDEDFSKIGFEIVE